jgi:hypothetical protein
LRDAFKEAFPAIRPTVILGALADKNWNLMVPNSGAAGFTNLDGAGQ